MALLASSAEAGVPCYMATPGNDGWTRGRFGARAGDDWRIQGLELTEHAAAEITQIWWDEWPGREHYLEELAKSDPIKFRDLYMQTWDPGP